MQEGGVQFGQKFPGQISSIVRTREFFDLFQWLRGDSEWNDFFAGKGVRSRLVAVYISYCYYLGHKGTIKVASRDPFCSLA